jgi:hypothetical protein
MKVYHEWFIAPQILNYERGLSLSPGPKAVLFCLAKFHLEALFITILNQYDEKKF